MKLSGIFCHAGLHKWDIDGMETGPERHGGAVHGRRMIHDRVKVFQMAAQHCGREDCGAERGVYRKIVMPVINCDKTRDLYKVGGWRPLGEKRRAEIEKMQPLFNPPWAQYPEGL